MKHLYSETLQTLTQNVTFRRYQDSDKDFILNTNCSLDEVLIPVPVEQCFRNSQAGEEAFDYFLEGHFYFNKIFDRNQASPISEKLFFIGHSSCFTSWVKVEDGYKATRYEIREEQVYVSEISTPEEPASETPVLVFEDEGIQIQTFFNFGDIYCFYSNSEQSCFLKSISFERAGVISTKDNLIFAKYLNPKPFPSEGVNMSYKGFPVFHTLWSALRQTSFSYVKAIQKRETMPLEIVSSETLLLSNVLLQVSDTIWCLGFAGLPFKYRIGSEKLINALVDFGLGKTFKEIRDFFLEELWLHEHDIVTFDVQAIRTLLSKPFLEPNLCHFFRKRITDVIALEYFDKHTGAIYETQPKESFFPLKTFYSRERVF